MNRMPRLMLTLLLPVLLFSHALPAVAATEITWFGHSAFRITTPSGKVLLIDPWVTNPANPGAKKDMEALKKVDLILLTHGHGDHIGNTVDIAKATGAKLVGTFDLTKAMVQYGGFPEGQTGMPYAGHFGGEISLLDGEVRVQFVPALHGGSMEAAEGSKAPKSLVYSGDAGAFLISVKGGPTVYHTGDTDLFSDMSLLENVDIMIACIGDKFTMGPKRAAKAVKFVKPKMAIPMHYGTFPVLTGTPAAFKAELDKLGLKKVMREMKVGETLVWK